MSYELALYRSAHQDSFEGTASAFEAWLLAQGLKCTPSPGGTMAWAGLHGQGDREEWYALTTDDHLLYLRVTANAASRQITASTSYEGSYTADELAETRRRNHELWLNIIWWFRANASGNEVAKHPEQWFSDARLKIDDAYTR